MDGVGIFSSIRSLPKDELYNGEYRGGVLMSAKSAPATDLYKGGILRSLRSEPMGDIYGGGILKFFIPALKKTLPKILDQTR